MERMYLRVVTRLVHVEQYFNYVTLFDIQNI